MPQVYNSNSCQDIVIFISQIVVSISYVFILNCWYIFLIFLYIHKFLTLYVLFHFLYCSPHPLSLPVHLTLTLSIFLYLLFNSLHSFPTTPLFPKPFFPTFVPSSRTLSPAPFFVRCCLCMVGQIRQEISFSTLTCIPQELQSSFFIWRTPLFQYTPPT